MDQIKNTQSQSNDSDVHYQHTYEMLKYYQDEYFRRHAHLWATLKMFFGLNIAISLLPFISGIFGIEIKSSALPILIFPIVGFLVATISAFILYSEVRSFNLIAEKKRNISKMLPLEYQYLIIKTEKKAAPQKTDKQAAKTKRKKNYMSYKLVWLNLFFQIIIAAIALVFCLI